MKKALLLGVLMAAAPAMAGVTYTPIPATYPFGIGLYNPANPAALNTVYITGAGPSDTFVLTFAAHMNAIFYNTEFMHFNFVYDSDCVDVLGARPVNANGVWVADNYSTFVWPNVSSGYISVFSLAQSAGVNSAFVSMPTSSIVPFFQVTLHAKGAMASHVGLFGITQMILVSHTFALTLFPSSFAYGLGAIHHVPEPSTLTLIGGALAAVAGGVIRRRR